LHGDPEEAAEPFGGGVLSPSHRTHDYGEGFELEPLLTEDRMGLEEGDHPLEEIAAVPNHEDQGPVTPASSCVASHTATAETALQEQQDRRSFRILTHMQLRHELPPRLRGRIPLDRDVEATFPVDIARQIVVQPFLLIVRRGH